MSSRVRGIDFLVLIVVLAIAIGVHLASLNA
jgi:hypothetical protein